MPSPDDSVADDAADETDSAADDSVDTGPANSTDDTGMTDNPQVSGQGETEPGTATDAEPGEETGVTAEEAVSESVVEHTTDERDISPRIQIYWSVRLLLGLAILTGIGVMLAVRFDVNPLFVAGVAVILAVVGLVWIHTRYRVWCYRLRTDALYLERGVVTHVRTVVPHVRIQHVDTSRSPLERVLGLSTLVVYTAGSRGADVSIPGLTPAEAGDMQRRLKELAIESEGDDAL